MKISELVNRVEPFCFEFDGEKLEGTYYKYRTTTPNYVQALFDSVPKKLESGTEEELKANEEARTKATLDVSLKVIADTVITWNAEDDDGNPVPPNLETFKQLPEVFTVKFAQFVRDLREGNPTNGNGSPVG